MQGRSEEGLLPPPRPGHGVRQVLPISHRGQMCPAGRRRPRRGALLRPGDERRKKEGESGRERGRQRNRGGQTEPSISPQGFEDCLVLEEMMEEFKEDLSEHDAAKRLSPT